MAVPYREISAATTFPFSGLDPLGRNGMAAAIAAPSESDSLCRLIPISTDQPFLCALEDLRNVSFDAAPLLSVHADDHLVSVHHAAHFAAIEINVVCTLVIRDEKTITVWVGLESSSYQVLASGRP